MIKKSQFIDLIRQGSFKELFISELGWNSFRGQAELPEITVDNRDYHVFSIAERNGFQILTCEVDEIPTQSLARKIDSKLRRQAQDYICIYRLKNTGHDLWVVPVRSNEKRDLVLIEYESAEKAELLYSKIDGFSFALDETTNIVDLRAKVQGTFAVNSEKITKDFYSGFKKEHKAFAEFITGIDDQVQTKDNKNKQWYTSVMLNRLMFCYFIQKKGFLNFDTDYLRNKLNWVRQEKGENRFFSTFYRGFLSNLFHDGLNTPVRDRAFIEKYGRIPYLNGGMFDEHQLEHDYRDIDIADEAFIRLFAFFDKWRWHLDTRITASGKDINPDVLGYIFEQYINDRAQMGAYYTKEDITEYIGRNCILPFLFDETKRIANDDGGYFKPSGYVWKTLRESGDKYIFDAVKKGYADFDRIPENIRRGIITEEMKKEYSETPVGELPADHIPLATLRSDWNTRTPERWGLPTEIWRETIERLQRCGDIINKIQKGEITSINDFITYNLDIRSFAHDLLANGASRFVGRFYKALQKVTILDPTCGSGAFLFAAMNILEPLYEICIERMQEFNANNDKLFKEELAEISNKYRSNIQYFIFKSIILRNLYGVDIMVEATEIAKLRLFLKMVAVVDVDRRADNLGLDPLPDIDFNIRCGNTLVGYANEKQLNNDLTVANGDWVAYEANMRFKDDIDKKMRLVALAFNRFRQLQLVQEMNMTEFKQAKADLRALLQNLNDLLNHRLFEASGHHDYNEWLASHQPFNWLAEFYQIIQENGGFDVIIGNPPYVEYNKKDSLTLKTVSQIYSVNCKKTLSCSNLYAFVIERCDEFCNPLSNYSLIVPMSLLTTERMQPARSIILTNPQFTSLINLAGDWHPGKLFEGVRSQFTIITCIQAKQGNTQVLSTDYLRWYNRERINLFKSQLKFTINNYDSTESVFPKIGSKLEAKIQRKVSEGKGIYNMNVTNGYVTHYRNAGIAYYNIAITFDQHFSTNGIMGRSSTLKDLFFKYPFESEGICALLNSNTFALIYFIFSDCYHLTTKDIARFKFPSNCLKEISNLNKALMESLNKNSILKITEYKTKGTVKYQEFYPRYSKSFMDEIDTVLARHYGFTDEELDFIINYDIKYRMGDELNNEE